LAHPMFAPATSMNSAEKSIGRSRDSTSPTSSTALWDSGQDAQAIELQVQRLRRLHVELSGRLQSSKEQRGQLERELYDAMVDKESWSKCALHRDRLLHQTISELREITDEMSKMSALVLSACVCSATKQLDLTGSTASNHDAASIGNSTSQCSVNTEHSRDSQRQVETHCQRATNFCGNPEVHSRSFEVFSKSCPSSYWELLYRKFPQRTTCGLERIQPPPGMHQVDRRVLISCPAACPPSYWEKLYIFFSKSKDGEVVETLNSEDMPVDCPPPPAPPPVPDRSHMEAMLRAQLEELAAIKIQKAVRGHAVRKRVKLKRNTCGP